MRIVVQKFGGTSVATPERRLQVVGHVEAARQDGHAVVVVVSAMGRKGEPYATDSLIELLRQEAGAIPDPREQDQLMACGEVIACAVVSQALIRHGIPSVSLTGAQAGIITEGRHGEARILEVRTQRILNELSAGRVPVVAGFQGVSENGEVTTLGRGGSDTTAAALGVALGAEMAEIYTDVDGLKAADPAIVPDAPTLGSVAYREASELAHLGAKVVHPRAVEIAMEGHLMLRIRQTGSAHPGTLVWDRPAGGAMEIRSDRPVVGIAHVANLAQVVVSGPHDFNDDALNSRLLDAVARRGVSIDLILVSPRQLMFCIPEAFSAAVHEVLAEFDVEVAVTPRLAKVSVVGAGMHGVPGVMARVARALAGAGVAILQTSDSHASISCLVDEERLGDAMRALFDEFDLGLGGRGERQRN